MKKLYLIIAVLLSVILPVCGCKEDVEYDVTECAFTSFTAEDFEGEIIDESIFAEYEITMINVWGTYCSPCKREIPALVELSEEYEGRVQVMGIPVDLNNTGSAEARTIMAEWGITYKNIKISNSIKSFVDGISLIPYTIFINSEGYQLGGAYVGANSKKEWKKIVENMLDFVNSRSN